MENETLEETETRREKNREIFHQLAFFSNFLRLDQYETRNQKQTLGLPCMAGTYPIKQYSAASQSKYYQEGRTRNRPKRQIWTLQYGMQDFK